MHTNSRLAGLIGTPVAHSISPVFQQAAFDALGINACYERWETTPEQLPARMGSLRHKRFMGANVTVPHKEAVIAFLDEIAPSARRAGAVNTVCNRSGTLSGTNTDISGFRRALRDSGGFDARGQRATVLGAGGAARAIVIALEQEGASVVAIANRHAERARRLTDELQSDAGPELIPLAWEDAVSVSHLRDTDLLIHCTTLGMAGSRWANESAVPGANLGGRLFVCDIVANPLLTPLLRSAAAAGARILGGLAMLVYQGAASFEEWTGRSAPIEVMMSAAEAAMVHEAGARKQD